MKTPTKAGLAVGALTVAAAGFWLTGTSNAVGPSPVPIVQAAETQCVTDASGLCTVTHSLGAVPAAIVVSPNTPSQFNAYILNTVGGTYTATTFQVRAMFNQTTPKANGTIWFTYAAYGTAATTPPPTTPVTPTTPQMTPTPTPTTPTTPAFPTTTGSPTP